MIFLLRILVFSFLIFLGFHLSVRSKKGRAFVSVAYGCVLVWYTFLCRIRLSVDVAAGDYDHILTTSKSVGEKIWSIIKAIFGMDASGHLAGVYWQAGILNCLLFVPLGYLLMIWMIDGDRRSSAVSNPVKDVAATGRDVITRQNLKRAVWSSLLICIATSITIELLQGLTHLGMTDLNDVIANSIGGGVGIFITLVWLRKQNCVGE